MNAAGASGGRKPAESPARAEYALPSMWERIIDPQQVPDMASLLALIADALTTPIGFSLAGVNPGGGFLLWSRGSAAMYGYDAAEMLGRGTFADLFRGPPASGPTWRECLDLALRDGRWAGVSTHVRSDRTEFQARTIITPVRHRPGGGLLGFLIATQDASAEVRQADELAADNYRMRGILAAARLPLLVTDLAGAIGDANAAAEKLTGRTRGELLGAGLADCFTEPGQAHELARLVIRDRQVTGHAMSLQHHDGRTIGVSADGTLLLDPDGKPRGMAVQLADLTESRRLLAALDDAREFNERAIEAAADGLIAVAADGVITNVSDHLCAMSGFSREELTGSPFREYFADPERAQEAVDKSYQTGSLRGFPLALATSDGTVRQVMAQTWVVPEKPEPGRRMFALLRDVTEETADRERAARERAYARGLLEASLDGLATVDLRGRISDTNARMCELMERSREQLTGSAFAGCFTEPGEATELVHRALISGKATDCELRPASGRQPTLSVNASALRDPAGQAAGVFVSARDVSEQSRQQQTLASQEAYHRALVESSAEAFFAISPAGVITDANPPASALTGYSGKHLVGRPFGELFSDPGAARRMISDAFRRGPVADCQLVLAGTGKQRVLSFNAGVYRDPAGHSQGLLAAARDITAQQELAERLRSQQYYTRSLIEANADAMMVIDLAGLIADVNSGMEGLLGRSRDELIGTLVIDYALDAQVLTNALSQVLRDGHIEDLELLAQRPDGSTTLASCNASTFADSGGKLQGIIASARDVTERKRLEALQQQMLDEARKLDRAKDDLVSRISHDLRSPLTSILGYLEILEAGQPGQLNAEQRRIVGIIGRAGQRLLALMEDLLLLSRIDSGRNRTAREPVEPGPIIEEVRESFLPAIREGQLTVDLDLGRHLVVQADAAQLERVVANLISNAIKFTPPGGRIDVSTRQDGGQFVLKVHDTGIGIPAEEQDRLFTRFFRSSASSQLQQDGTGLGLYIVKQVAEDHGGSVTAESAAGAGSTFTVRLPLSPPEPPARPAGAGPPRPPPAGRR